HWSERGDLNFRPPVLQTCDPRFIRLFVRHGVGLENPCLNVRPVHASCHKHWVTYRSGIVPVSRVARRALVAGHLISTKPQAPTRPSGLAWVPDMRGCRTSPTSSTSILRPKA